MANWQNLAVPRQIGFDDLMKRVSRATTYKVVGSNRVKVARPLLTWATLNKAPLSVSPQARTWKLAESADRTFENARRKLHQRLRSLPGQYRCGAIL
ncbi:MAG: hypothetical protein DWQ09_12875 [Proteobacteria bacterium]|nr:MAG: hypothetical protein DWQ09_12875 [Pseudomonadota bacterium]